MQKADICFFESFCRFATNPLSEQFAKRIAHLLREGEGFRGAIRLCRLVGDPSTILLRKIAYGTAQDDSVFFYGRELFCRLRDKPLIRAIRRRIAHLLREGEGFRGAIRLCRLVGDPSTILLRKIAYGTAQNDSFISSKFKV